MEATCGSGPSACRYDVFLSFRGPDTRNNFTDCLYMAMVDQGINVYIDNEELHAGDRIDDLLKAIGNSKICIPVFSKGYASSHWCLRELVHMMDLNESTGKPAILPIFFDVTPSDVKLKTKVYGDYMEKHEQTYGKEIRQQWEVALRKVPETKGWEVQSKKFSEVIELVLKEVLRKMKVKQRNLDGKLVGVDKQVEGIMELLDVDSRTGVRFVGIYGMGGIGKTTLAKIVFNKLCPRFDGPCSFIENIRESSKRKGLVDLQKKLASDISNSRFVGKFSDIDEGIDSIRRIAGSKKVLLVLDDLDKKEQLKNLVGGSTTFGSGSRIIITTRDKQIMDAEDGILAYEVKQMDSYKALQLFSLHAFNSVSPPYTHQSLSEKVVSTTGGLPLALEVIGSYLRNQEEEIWNEMLGMLKKVPHDEVMNKLKISYDALKEVEKEVFLDIACFFMNEEKSTAIHFWDACSLYPRNSLKRLTNLCLVKIESDDNIWMHDQLRDLGRDIIRQECTWTPTRRSRLWNCEEALEVVKSKERKGKLQALNLVGDHSSAIIISHEELERMPNLKFLELKEGTFVGDVSNYLQKLRWFSWYSPPLHRTMAKLHLKNLVVFTLWNNENDEDWGGWNILKMENRLKVLSLFQCDGLKWTPDFSGCLGLKRLSIKHCSNLQEVSPSIGKLEGLTHLNIEGCHRLQNLPKEIGGLVNLEHFIIKDCFALEKLPLSFSKLASSSELRLAGAKITYLPDSIGNAEHMSLLDLSSRPIVHPSISIGELMQLEFLELSSGGNSREVPESIGNLTSLQNLNITKRINVELPTWLERVKASKVATMGRKIRRLPTGIGMLERLKELHARDYYGKITYLPDAIVNAKHLSLLDLSSTSIVKLPSAIGQLMQLKSLQLYSCRSLQKLPESIGNLTSLQYLNITETIIIELPDSIQNLRQLKVLNMTCTQIRRLPTGIGMLKSLEELHAPRCEQLAGELPTEIGGLTSLSILDIAYTRVCSVPTNIISLTRLQKLDLMGCHELEKLPELPPSLTCLRVISKSLQLVPDLSYLTNLEELFLSTGFGPARARESSPTQTLQLQWVGKLSNLKMLSFDAPAPPTVGCQTGLAQLNLSSMDSFDSITVGPQFSNLKYLCRLTLFNSPLKEMQLAGLELLWELNVCSSDLLERLSFMSSSLRKISNISVRECPRLLEIRFLGTMESLQFLQIYNLKSLKVLQGLSNAEKLQRIWIVCCHELQVVESLEGLCSSECGSMEGLTNVPSNSKIPNECWIEIKSCAKLNEYEDTYGDYREMIAKRTKWRRDLKDSMEENDIVICSDSEDTTKDNDNIDCFMGIVECICKPLRFFQGRNLQRQVE